MSTTESDTRAATAALSLDYLPLDRLESQPSPWWRNVLGVVGFARPPALRGRVPVAATLTPTLDGNTDLCEVWRVGDARSQVSLGSAQLGRVRYRFSDDLLFGCLSIEEREVLGCRHAAGAQAGAAQAAAAADEGAQALLHAAEVAYEEIFAVLDATQHQHLIRIWNYVPGINAAAGKEERYRLFNSARQAAFRKSGRAIQGCVPAACALGSPAGSPISIYFLAARRSPKTIENPRQTSAYHYPPKFGKHSPIFSRACIFGGPQQANLFISGTASIVGHETIHHGNARAQTHETLANIRALLGEANRVAGSERYSMDALKYKVYVRHAADLGAIQGVLSRELRAHSLLYLQADICREELLVEIEATGESRRTSQF
jgi:enamine deaminase RidA (YjgF/YER057c/UK114 family)